MSSYNTPIVAQDGTVCGKLMMELVRTAGEMARHQEEEEEESSSESSVEETELTEPPGQLSFRLRLMSASGLPPALAHFVFCQFSVWDSEVDWSTLIGRAPTLLRSHWSRAFLSDASASNLVP